AIDKSKRQATSGAGIRTGGSVSAWRRRGHGAPGTRLAGLDAASSAVVVATAGRFRLCAGAGRERASSRLKSLLQGAASGRAWRGAQASTSAFSKRQLLWERL